MILQVRANMIYSDSLITGMRQNVLGLNERWDSYACKKHDDFSQVPHSRRIYSYRPEFSD